MWCIHTTCFFPSFFRCILYIYIHIYIKCSILIETHQVLYSGSFATCACALLYSVILFGFSRSWDWLSEICYQPGGAFTEIIDVGLRGCLVEHSKDCYICYVRPIYRRWPRFTKQKMFASFNLFLAECDPFWWVRTINEYMSYSTAFWMV